MRVSPFGSCPCGQFLGYLVLIAAPIGSTTVLVL